METPALPLSVERLNVTVHPAGGARGARGGRGTREARDLRILCDIDLTAGPGEIVAVVGESGCGKSTLAAAVAGLLSRGTTTFTGAITLDGTETTRLPEKDLRKLRGSAVGYIPQDHIGAFNPVLTVARHLTEGPMAHLGISRANAQERARELVRMVRLDDVERVLGSYPHQLSGGMRQRVMIAAAMACGPRLLVADEPTTALDVTVQKEILALLRELCDAKGTAMLLISHDLSVVAGVADRVAVLYSGEVVEEGPATAILTTPRHPYTEALLRSVPDPDHPEARSRPLATIPGQPPDIASRPDGCWFHPRCPYATTPDDCATAHPPLVTMDDGRRVRTFHPRTASAQAPAAEPRQGISAASAARYPSVAGTGTLLEVTDLTKSYTRHGNVALRDVALTITQGQTYGLVGESGSGKSTLAHCVLQLARPYQGTIAFDGRPLDKLAGPGLRGVRKQVQVIFQDARNSLDQRMTIGAAVEEALRIHEARAKNTRERAREALNEVGLGESIAERYPRQCSGGELQRACIARALILKPKLLICDEAVSSLDVSTRAQVLNLLRDLQRDEGIAMLFITHDFGTVAAMSDMVGVLDHGDLVESGAAASVLRDPRHDYTRRLLNAVPRLTEPSPR